MSDASDPGLSRVLAALDADPAALLGCGGEARVYALAGGRVARVYHPATSEAVVRGRSKLLEELGHSAHAVPFAIPRVLETRKLADRIVTIECRLPGRPFAEVLGAARGVARRALVTAYLDAATRIGDLSLARTWYGDLLSAGAVRTPSFRAYLRRRAALSLERGGAAFARVDPEALAAALPEPEGPAFVHLDFFPGNVLAEDEGISSVLDFGVVAIMGDRRLEPLAAAAYLDREISPVASDEDRRIARGWLRERGLEGLYEPARRWLAAFWSAADDDAALAGWCRRVLEI